MKFYTVDPGNNIIILYKLYKGGCEMKKRKLVALIMALTLAAALVNGCGDPGTGSDEQPAETGAAEGTETGTAQEEAVPNRFKFTGQQLDPVTQQYYLRARFYNPDYCEEITQKVHLE